MPYILGWVLLALISLLQPPGLVAADTKHDLAVDPAGFLSQATHAWTDTFTLGQLQNQAYGYLFPHGAFFVLTDPLPDWIAQRLWWLLVTGVGYSGFLLLTQRINVGSPAFGVLASLLFALSPRTLTTLTAISSETWPVMLAPWVLLPFLGPLGLRAVAAATIPVAMMGAVNATATIAACLPAGLVIVWRLLRRDGHALRTLTGWLAGCLLVSLWWIGPLLVLGHYSVPFTDFIESSYVTTRWLNLIEILRGTTSWAPFVDTERQAGHLLVSSPVFVLATTAVAALGLWGLTLRTTPHRRLWVGMLLTGVAVLGAAHGPLAGQWLTLLDGPLAAFRNLHKFDPLVRIPLLIGVAALGTQLRIPSTWGGVLNPGRREATAVLVIVIGVASMAPAWSGRLLPRGAYEYVPAYWQEATNLLNAQARGTRTLIVPEASFARQTWGWTRDEPAQPLLDVPWAVRDAVPLIPPEAVRGLDGVMAVLHHDPAAGADALRRLGIGAVLNRGDLVGGAEQIDVERLAGATGSEVHRFGAEEQLEVVILDPVADLALTDQQPVRVAGGGESLAVLDMIHGPGPRVLVDSDAEIVTDTPALTVRHYGTLEGAVSAPLADLGESVGSRNAVPDYPSAGPFTRVQTHGGTVTASSSAADAGSFGGADAARSITAAVDGEPDTAWWPTPGPPDGQWLELAPDRQLADPAVTIAATDDTTIDLNGRTVEIGEEPTTFHLRGTYDTLRVTLTGPQPVGLSEITIDNHRLERVVTVPDTSPDVRQFLFQRLTLDTGHLIRDFTAPRPMQLLLNTPSDAVTIDDVEYSPGDLVELTPGVHRLATDAEWVTLTEEGFDPSPAFGSTGRDIAAADDTDRILLTGRSANPGLQASVAGLPLEPLVVDAATQAFRLPAGTGGRVEFSFAGDPAYRGLLFGGGALALLTVLGAAVVVIRGRRGEWTVVGPRPGTGVGLLSLGAVTAFLVAGWPGLLAAMVALLVLRVTLIPAGLLAFVLLSVAGAWLARGPWPSGDYAGDSAALALLLVAALISLLPGSSRNTWLAAATGTVSTSVTARTGQKPPEK
ncbi:alpha-(1-_3)-arabinofuranosyltransferase domain-containing protein [Corynebacterium comes]|uniref:Alpha-(1->3)-arabinofuranosyltransferase n=1 Tax=Corynebacterium comes TaxID=2675218 RepID=A0A6B8W106_9CORY|nr:alpha-(1->3)-arabinofuranosyltransferase family protein [Corynebacterium comes]QGU05687.1 Alpha-(1->3)-arabinofuranosyltransferase [Corynebacterium comes]